MQDGFIYDELSDFRKDLLNQINNLYPKASKNFIWAEGRKLQKLQKKIAKQDVGTTGKNGDKSYHKKFECTKPTKNGDDLYVKAQNTAPHAHLIEYGHMNVPRSEKPATTREGRKRQQAERIAKGTYTYTQGKYVMKKSEMQFPKTYEEDCEKFLYKYFDDIGK